jgi:hypothetical protein
MLNTIFIYQYVVKSRRFNDCRFRPTSEEADRTKTLVDKIPLTMRYPWGLPDRKACDPRNSVKSRI